MGKGGKGGKGRMGKFLGLAAGLAFGFAGGAWGFLNGVSSFGRVMYGLSLGMSIGGLFDKQNQQSVPESTFDSKNNQVTSEGTIPIVYGQTKVGGLQTFHNMDIDGKKLEKHVVLCEGPITDIFGITANGYLTSVKRQGEDRQRNVHIFGIRNNKYKDATVEITTRKIGNRVYTGTGFKRIKGDWSIYQDNLNYGQFDKFPKLILSAGGKTTAFFLTDDNTNVDPKYILACNTFGKLYQIVLGDTYISDLQIDGWELENPVICQDSPSKARTFAPVNCYKNTINIYTNGEQDAKDSTVYTYLGTREQEAPSSYKTTGGYPYMAYVNADLRYTDKMGAGNPTVTAIVKGRKVYDWRTKTTAFTKNPAVCLWEYMTNEVYGAGRYIATDLLDMDSFTDVANYCDEIITYTDPYGVIKSEPRYQLDICLNETKTHLENIQSILNSFLGFLVFSNNKIKLRCERLETPVYAFNDDNIIEKSLSYKSASIDQSPNKFNITYVEPALDYTAVKLIVEDTTNQLPPPIGIGRPVEQDIDFKGVRRQTQCLRLGKIARDIIRLCPITVSFKTGLMASHLEAGDIITVSKTYIDENGDKQELFTNQQARITEIKEEDGTFEITARQYNPSIYDDTFGASLKVFSPTGNNPKEISLVPETVKPVENVRFTQIYRGKKEGIPLYDVVCTFEPPDDIEYRTSRVYVQIISGKNTGEWKDYGEQSSIVQIIGVHKEDTVNIRIVPIDSKMNEHDESMVQQSYKVVSKFDIPDAPKNIRLTVKDSAVLTWDAVTNTDVEHYEISLDGNFQNGAMITNNNTYNINLFSRSGRVYVRAVNIDGVAGASAFITYNYPAPPMPIIKKTIGQRGSAQVILGSTPVMPAPVLKVKYRIGGKEIVSNETVYTHVNDAGVYTFTVAYQDYFGNGAWTPETALVIKPDINQELFNKAQQALNRADAINAEMNTALSSVDSKLANVKKSLDSKIADNITLFRQEISSSNQTITATLTQTAAALQDKVKDIGSKVESVKIQTAKALQNSVTNINAKIESVRTQTASALQDKVTNINTKIESVRTQTAKALQDRVSDINSKIETTKLQTSNMIDSAVKAINGKEIISRINQSEGGTRIDGRLLHVTSDAVFDKNVIANNIDSRSITMDKLAGGTIDLLSMDSSINAGAVHLDKNGMRVSSSSGAYTTYNQDGIRWFDRNGKPFGVITQMLVGQAYHGDYVRLDWTEKPTVIIIPEQANNIQSIVPDDSCSGYVINKAIEVSPKGFRIQSFTQPATTYCADSQGYW